MKDDIIDKKSIIKEISKMSFHAAIDFFLDNLTYYALIKSRQNYYLSNLFLMYIKNNYEKFKEYINSNEKLRYSLTQLFHLNTKIKEENLVTLIIDDEKNEELVTLLNEKIAFDDIYLNDDTMSTLMPNNIEIFKTLKGEKRKYLYALTNSVCITYEDQKDTYHKVLNDLPKKFVDDLFVYSNIIRDNTPNESETYEAVTKMMFEFTKSIISNPNSLYIYLYNLSKLYKGNVSEKSYYNTFLLSKKYPNIHKELIERKIDNDLLYKKIQILSYLPPLVGIDDIATLDKMDIRDIYTSDLNDALDMKEFDASPSANVYEYSIFDTERQVIGINEKEIKTAYADISHYHTLLTLYPDYCLEETINDVVKKVNQINHDILLITEGDTLVIWLPTLQDISSGSIENLKEKLNEIKNFEEISIQIAIENNDGYTPVPFQTVDTLIEYLNNCKRVKK